MSDYLPPSQSRKPLLEEPSTSNGKKRKNVEPLKQAKKKGKFLSKKKNVGSSVKKNDKPLQEKEKKYEVEKILDRKIVDDKKFYLVKWKNYEDSENTWEPFENFTRSSIIINFEIKFQLEKYQPDLAKVCLETQDINLWPCLSQLKFFENDESATGKLNKELLKKIDMFRCQDKQKFMFVVTTNKQLFVVGLKRVTLDPRGKLWPGKKKNSKKTKYPYCIFKDKTVCNIKPQELVTFADKKISQIVCGADVCMIRTENGELYEFPIDYHDRPSFPEPLIRMGKFERKAVMVKCGLNHTAVIDNNGCLHTWGSNAFNQVGRVWFIPDRPHRNDDYNHPIQNEKLHKNVIQVECGAYFTVALTSNSEVYYTGIYGIDSAFSIMWNKSEPVIALGRLSNTVNSFSLITENNVYFCHFPTKLEPNVTAVHKFMTSFCFPKSAINVLHYSDGFVLVETRSNEKYVLNPCMSRGKYQLKIKPLSIKVASLVDLAALMGYYETFDLITVKQDPTIKITALNVTSNDMHAYRIYTGPLLFKYTKPPAFIMAHFDSNFLSTRSPKFFEQIETQRNSLEPLSLGQYLYAYWLYTNQVVDKEALCFIYFVYGYYMHRFIQVEPGKENPDLVLAKSMADTIVGKLSEFSLSRNETAFNEYLNEKLTWLIRYDQPMARQLLSLFSRGKCAEAYLMFGPLRQFIKYALRSCNYTTQVANVNVFE